MIPTPDTVNNIIVSWLLTFGYILTLIFVVGSLIYEFVLWIIFRRREKNARRFPEW